MLHGFVLPTEYDSEHEMSVYQGSLLQIRTKSEEVYQGTPPLWIRQIGKVAGYLSSGSRPSWRARATAWVRLLTFSLP